MGCSLIVQHVYDSGQVETLARRLASQFGIKHGLGPVRFKLDCFRLVQARMDPVYKDIGKHLQKLPGSYFHHISMRRMRLHTSSLNGPYSPLVSNFF